MRWNDVCNSSFHRQLFSHALAKDRIPSTWFKKKTTKNFHVFSRGKMFVEKWLKIIARKMGPSSPCKVEIFWVFCTKPPSQILCQGLLQVQRALPGKGWLMVPLGKRGDSAPCPAGGWDVRARPCADDGTWAHESMPGSSIHHLPQKDDSSLLGEGWDLPRASCRRECQGFP